MWNVAAMGGGYWMLTAYQKATGPKAVKRFGPVGLAGIELQRAHGKPPACYRV